MKVFADTANVDEIRELKALGLLDGAAEFSATLRPSLYNLSAISYRKVRSNGSTTGLSI